MFQKTLTLVLLGVLVVGAVVIGYGSFYDKGFASSVASVIGAGGDDEHESGKGGKEKHEDDDDD